MVVVVVARRENESGRKSAGGGVLWWFFGGDQLAMRRVHCEEVGSCEVFGSCRKLGSPAAHCACGGLGPKFRHQRSLEVPPEQ